MRRWYKEAGELMLRLERELRTSTPTPTYQKVVIWAGVLITVALVISVVAR